MMIGELLAVYIEDLRDSLIQLDEGLMALQNGVRDETVLNNIFRVAHTIKGNSAAMDFIKVEKVMHSMEDILQDVRSGSRELTDNIVDILYRCHDFLQDCIGVVARDHSDERLIMDDILGQLEREKNGPVQADVNDGNPFPEQAAEEQELIKVIEANCQIGYTPYELSVTFIPDCIMRSVRAWLVFESVDNHAILVFSHPERPSEETFRSPDYSFDADTIRMVVLCENSIDDLVNNLKESAEIKNVDSRLFNSIDEIESFIKKIGVEQELLRLIGATGAFLLEDDINAGKVSQLAGCLEKIAAVSSREEYSPVMDSAAAAAQVLHGEKGKLPNLNKDGIEALASMVQIMEEYIRNGSSDDHQYVGDELTGCLEILGTGMTQPDKVGEILVQKGLLEEYEVDELLKKQKMAHPGLKFGQVAVKENKVPAFAVMQALNEQRQEKPKSNTTISQGGFVRVPVGKVDTLMDMLGELLILNSQLEQRVSDAVTRDSGSISVLSRTAKLIKSIQALSMTLRMVEIRPTLHRLTRIARDTAAELNKRVSVVLEGEETEIDRSAAEKIFDPLMHLVRNAVSHGVEEEEQRIAAGKKTEGQVGIRCYSKRGNVYIEVSDDGRGMDLQNILAKAKSLGMAEDNRDYSDEEILRFIFRPGFSTQEYINNISGRGVGMNVVEEEVKRNGGKVDIVNRPGLGCTFILRIPMNLAVINGTIVDVAGSRYIIPTLFIKEFYVADEDRWISVHGELSAVRLREMVVPVLWPSRLFGAGKEEQNRLRRELVMLEMDQKLLTFPVDRIISRQEIVAKPLLDELSNIGFASGASILSDGSVALILDVEAMFGMANQKSVMH